MTTLVSKRRKEMVRWAVLNLEKWPTHACISEADPEEIACSFISYPGDASLPVLRCNLGGGIVDSTDWFYARRSKN